MQLTAAIMWMSASTLPSRWISEEGGYVSFSWVWSKKPKQMKRMLGSSSPLHPRSQKILKLFFPTPFSTQPSSWSSGAKW